MPSSARPRWRAVNADMGDMAVCFLAHPLYQPRCGSPVQWRFQLALCFTHIIAATPSGAQQVQERLFGLPSLNCHEPGPVVFSFGRRSVGAGILLASGGKRSTTRPGCRVTLT
jgi:hypothetical protein